MNRREFLGLFSATGSAAAAGCLGGGGGRDRGRRRGIPGLGGGWELDDHTISDLSSGPGIALEPVIEGLEQPLSIRFPTEDIRYIADKTGLLRLHDEDGLREEPLLDLRDRMLDPLVDWEQGFVGMNIHPEFAENGRLFVRYSAPPREEYPDNYSHTYTLSEFQVGEDLRHADPGSERILLQEPEPGVLHQAGGIEWGPEGYLYVTIGDAGGTADSVFNGFRDVGPGHPDDWYAVNRGGNGQDVTHNLHGSILRIDVDSREDGKPYGIPDDNPLVGEKGLDEHWAWGLRNPYQISFDPESDRLFAGDVGNRDYEEINIIEKGGNYGWNVREGNMCYNANSGLRGPTRFLQWDSLPACPSRTTSGEPLIDPVVVYPHTRDGQEVGSAVIGGHVYRNDTVESLQDRYVFGDAVWGRTGGVIFVTDETEERPWPMQKASISTTENGEINAVVLSFGRDPDGELYVLTTRFAEGSGVVYRITEPD